MPQRDLLLPWRTAIDNAAIALENRGMKSAQARERTRPLFERFGLAEFEERTPAELSGGMRQRVAFLRTLMAEKDILLLDEPFAALDSITRSGMQEWLLSALEQEPRTVLLVTHDVDEALLLTHRVIVMSARPGTDRPHARDRPAARSPPPGDRDVAGVRGPQGIRARGAGAMSEQAVRPRTPCERARRARRVVDRYGPPALVVVLTIALWELIIRVFDVPTYIWSPPSLIAQTMQENFSELLHSRGRHAEGDPGRLLLRGRPRSGVRAPPAFLGAGQARPLSPPHRVAEHPDGRARAGVRAGPRVRPVAEGRGRDPLLLLPHRRRHDRRADRGWTASTSG